MLSANNFLECISIKSSTVLDQCGTGVVVTDLTGKIEYANKAFCRLSGYDRTEVLGQKVSLLKSGRTPPEVYQELWHTISEGKTWRGEICNLGKGGNLYWEAITITPIANVNGVVEKYVGTVEDITSRKKLEADREELLRSLREAQKTISGLHGLLPICSHCKSIRSSVGTWHTLENYLKEHSDAHLSHGICPDCLHKHYPEVEKNLIAKGWGRAA